MENDLDLGKDEPIVIADECGDCIWNAVLEQETKSCDIKTVSKNTTSLLHDIDTVQMSNS